MDIFSQSVYECVRTRAIVTHQHQMLVLEPAQAGDGWRLPGGGLEPNESLADCAVREVLEETSIAIRVTNVAFLREFVIPKYCVIPDETRTTFGLEVYLYATPATDQIEPRRENAESPLGHWMPIADVPNLPLWPKELKTLAAQMAAGNLPQGVPSFVSQMESPDVAAPEVNFS